MDASRVHEPPAADTFLATWANTTSEEEVFEWVSHLEKEVAEGFVQRCLAELVFLLTDFRDKIVNTRIQDIHHLMCLLTAARRLFDATRRPPNACPHKTPEDLDMYQQCFRDRIISFFVDDLDKMEWLRTQMEERVLSQPLFYFEAKVMELVFSEMKKPACLRRDNTWIIVDATIFSIRVDPDSIEELVDRWTSNSVRDVANIFGINVETATEGKSRDAANNRQHDVVSTVEVLRAFFESYVTAYRQMADFVKQVTAAEWPMARHADQIHWYAGRQTHEGSLKELVAKNYGVTFYPNGDVFSGSWKERGRGSEVYWPDGQGMYCYADGVTIYSGGYKHGNRHGYGEQRCANGNVYQGVWKDGKKHGLGAFMKDSEFVPPHSFASTFIGSFDGDSVKSDGWIFPPCWPTGHVWKTLDGCIALPMLRDEAKASIFTLTIPSDAAKNAYGSLFELQKSFRREVEKEAPPGWWEGHFPYSAASVMHPQHLTEQEKRWLENPPRVRTSGGVFMKKVALNAVADQIKGARGGMYPWDWYAHVTLSPLFETGAFTFTQSLFGYNFDLVEGAAGVGKTALMLSVLDERWTTTWVQCGPMRCYRDVLTALADKIIDSTSIYRELYLPAVLHQASCDCSPAKLLLYQMVAKSLLLKQDDGKSRVLVFDDVRELYQIEPLIYLMNLTNVVVTTRHAFSWHDAFERAPKSLDTRQLLDQAAFTRLEDSIIRDNEICNMLLRHNDSTFKLSDSRAGGFKILHIACMVGEEEVLVWQLWRVIEFFHVKVLDEWRTSQLSYETASEKMKNSRLREDPSITYYDKLLKIMKDIDIESCLSRILLPTVARLGITEVDLPMWSRLWGTPFDPLKHALQTQSQQLDLQVSELTQRLEDICAQEQGTTSTNFGKQVDEYNTELQNTSNNFLNQVTGQAWSKFTEFSVASSDRLKKLREEKRKREKEDNAKEKEIEKTRKAKDKYAEIKLGFEKSVDVSNRLWDEYLHSRNETNGDDSIKRLDNAIKRLDNAIKELFKLTIDPDPEDRQRLRELETELKQRREIKKAYKRGNRAPVPEPVVEPPVVEPEPAGSSSGLPLSKRQLKKLRRKARGQGEQDSGATVVSLSNSGFQARAVPESSIGERRCHICMDNDITDLFIPCLHAQYCSACTTKIMAKNGLCPTCKAQIESVISGIHF